MNGSMLRKIESVVSRFSKLHFTLTQLLSERCLISAGTTASISSSPPFADLNTAHHRAPLWYLASRSHKKPVEWTERFRNFCSYNSHSYELRNTDYEPAKRCTLPCNPHACKSACVLLSLQEFMGLSVPLRCNVHLKYMILWACRSRVPGCAWRRCVVH